MTLFEHRSEHRGGQLALDDLFGVAPAEVPEVTVEPEPARPPAPRARARARRQPWEVERAKLKAWQRERRRTDRPLESFDYAGRLTLLDRSIETLRGHLARERAERLASLDAALSVAAGGGEA